jgi:hypothetical protein
LPCVPKLGIKFKINPLLDVPDLDDLAKRYASKRASDHAIVEALEVCNWYKDNRKIETSFSRLFMGVLKNKIQGRKAYEIL